MPRASLLVGLLVAGTTSILSAQAPVQQQPGRPAGAPAPAAAPGEIRGTVVEGSASTPVARASVAVRANGTLVTGAIAGTDGAFRIQGLRPGTYSLRVTYLGFAPKVQEVAVTAQAPVANVGAVRLARVAVALAGVSVVEERDAVTTEPDRNAYRAKAVAPAAANASEVLEAVPSVQVDHDGKVSLRGNENVAVQINGRPTPVRGAQLASYLKSLNANLVERVEVIPNPSAKYDPEGMAGIINIVLKQNVDMGLSAGLNLGVSQTDRYNASGNVGYQRGRMTAFVNGGITTDNRAIVGINDRERFGALSAPLSYTEQDMDGEVDNQGQSLSATVDVRLSKRDLLSNVLSFNRRSTDDASLLRYTELDAARVTVDRYDRTRGTDVQGNMFDWNVALRRTFEPRRHELSGEVRINRAHDEDRTTLWRQDATGAAPRYEGQVDDVDALTRTLNAQLDYTRPLGRTGKLETGYKGTARLLDRDYLVRKDALGTGEWLRSDLSNDFEFDERVNALYAVVSQPVGKLELQAGLRGELASRSFALADEEYPYDYGSLFPSGVVLYNVDQSMQAKASYSRRIRRPGTQELNPFPAFFDIQNVFIGNPNLSPEYTDALEFGLTKNGRFGNVQVQPFYRRTTNIIRVDIDPEAIVDGRDVTTVSFKNLATASSWGTDINGALRLGPKLNAFGGVNVFKMVTDGGSTSAVGSDAVAWMGRVNASSELTKTFMVQGSYFYRAPMKIEKGRFDATQMFSFSLRQKLRGDKAIATLRVNDPFQTMRFRIKTGNDQVVQLTERNFGSRTIFLNLALTYGQTPRVRQVQQDQQQQGGTGFP